MTEDERRIRLRTNLVILTPGDRGYQDWQDKRTLLALLDEARRTNTPGSAPGPAGEASLSGGTYLPGRHPGVAR